MSSTNEGRFDEADAAACTDSRGVIGTKLGPYRILSLIASGGMGEVYHAERADGQYEQAVAIKLVRAGIAGDWLEARFKAERQILASLDHPHLARLLDGGVTAGGRPYFVMELVRGEPIDACCERLQLPVNERLRLFRAVCSVVHYAHRKGVIHRDLKPSNVLVTEDGVVKLVDFGIAKRLQPDDTPQTVESQLPMTLAYSSPEQVRGAELGPASDVYTLGVLLHRLLTRAGPYAADSTDGYQLGRAICDTEPVPPSRALAPTDPVARAARRRLRGDLDAVVLMALRKNPERRYLSAEALSDDLFRHLEGLPVQARRGAWSYQAGRFVLRHRAVVGAAMVANLALVAGIALAGYQTWQANQQRERAERHFASVRQLANVLMVDVHKSIAGLPGSTAARKLIVQKALTYLQQLGTEARGDSRLQVELANGYATIGDIQGRPHSANLGDAKGALASYERGLALVQDLRASDAAADASALEVQARLTQRKGALLGAQGDDAQAERFLGQAVVLMDRLAARAPARREWQLQRAATYGQLSRTQRHTDKVEAFLTTSEAARGQYRQILREAPDEAMAASGLATTYLERGTYYLLRDTSLESARLAAQDFRHALEIQQPLVARHPDDARLKRNLAAHHANLGAALVRSQQPRDAAEAYRRARELIAELSGKDPANAQIRAELAIVTGSMSKALLATGDAQGAVQAAESAIGLYASLPEGSLRDVHTRYKQGVAHYLLGQTLEARAGLAGQDLRHARADRQAACSSYRQGLPILQELHTRFASGPTDITPDMLQQALRRCS